MSHWPFSILFTVSSLSIYSFNSLSTVFVPSKFTKHSSNLQYLHSETYPPKHYTDTSNWTGLKGSYLLPRDGGRASLLQYTLPQLRPSPTGVILHISFFLSPTSNRPNVWTKTQDQMITQHTHETEIRVSNCTSNLKNRGIDETKRGLGHPTWLSISFFLHRKFTLWPRMTLEEFKGSFMGAVHIKIHNL